MKATNFQTAVLYLFVFVLITDILLNSALQTGKAFGFTTLKPALNLIKQKGENEKMQYSMVKSSIFAFDDDGIDKNDSADGLVGQNGDYQDGNDDTDYFLNELEKLIASSSKNTISGKNSEVEEVALELKMDTEMNEDDIFQQMFETLPEKIQTKSKGKSRKKNQESFKDASDSSLLSDEDFMDGIFKELSVQHSKQPITSSLLEDDFMATLNSLGTQTSTSQRPKRRQREPLPNFNFPLEQDTPAKKQFQFDPLFKYSKRISECKANGQRNGAKALEILEEAKSDGLTPTSRMITEVMTQLTRSYQSETALKVFNQALQDGIQPDTYLFNGALTAASHTGNHKMIWDIFNQMSSFGIQADNYCFCSLINAMGKIGEKDLLLKAINEFENSGLDFGLGVYSSAISSLFLVKEKKTGMEYLQRMQATGIETDERFYASAIKALSSINAYEDALKLYQEMVQKGIRPSSFLYKNMLRACSISADWKTALEIFQDIQNTSDAGHLYLSQVLDILCQAGQNSEAMKLMQSISKQKPNSENVKLQLALISQYSKRKDYDRSLSVMRDIEKAGLALDKSGHDSIIISCKELNKVAEAWKAFYNMKAKGVKPDLLTYNHMLAVCSKGFDADKKVVELLDEMEAASIQADEISYTLSFKACAKNKISGADRALKLYRRMKASQIQPNLILFNSLITAGAQSGNWKMVEYLFEEMKLKGIAPDIISYNAALTACTNAGEAGKAVSLFEEMIQQNIKPDEIVIFTALRCVALAGDISNSMMFLSKLEAVNNTTDYSVAVGYRYAAMASLLAKDEDQAAMLWQQASNIKCTQLEDYNFGLRVCAEHGFWEFACDLVTEMRDEGIECEKSTFEQVIRACTKGGAPEIALEWLNEMLEENMEPESSLAREISHASVMSGDWESALAVLNKKDSFAAADRHLEPFLYSNAIIACANAQVFSPAMDVVTYVESKDMKLNTEAYNSILQLLLRLQKF